MAETVGAPIVGRACILLGLCSCSGETAVSAVSDAALDVADDTADDAIVADSETMADAASAPCPLTPPSPGAPCHSLYVCEYGNELSPTCDQLFECWGYYGDAAAWQEVGLTSHCPIAPPAGCPSTYPARADAGACAMGTNCSYAAGICQCNGTRWECLDAPASCPGRRPRLGTPCNVAMGPTESCPFEFDSFQTPWCTASSYRCLDGFWWAVGSLGCKTPPPPK